MEDDLVLNHQENYRTCGKGCTPMSNSVAPTRRTRSKATFNASSEAIIIDLFGCRFRIWLPDMVVAFREHAHSAGE